MDESLVHGCAGRTKILEYWEVSTGAYRFRFFLSYCLSLDGNSCLTAYHQMVTEKAGLNPAAHSLIPQVLPSFQCEFSESQMFQI